MGFYQEMTSIYGHEAVKKMKQWSLTNIKLANQLNRKHFLLKCRRYGIIPKHIMDSMGNVNHLFVTRNWKLTQKVNDFRDKLCNKIIN